MPARKTCSWSSEVRPSRSLDAAESVAPEPEPEAEAEAECMAIVVVVVASTDACEVLLDPHPAAMVATTAKTPARRMRLRDMSLLRSGRGGELHVLFDATARRG